MTSDDYAYVSANLRRLSGAHGHPKSSTISKQDPITELLHYYNSLFKYIHQSNIVEVLQ